MHSFNKVKLHVLAICVALALFFLPQVVLATVSDWKLTSPPTVSNTVYPTVDGNVYSTSTVDSVYVSVYYNGTGSWIEDTDFTTDVSGRVYWSVPYLYDDYGTYSVYGKVYSGGIGYESSVGSFVYGSGNNNNNPPPAGGGGGGGGGTTTTTPSTTVATSTISAADGGTITASGVTLDIPAGALGEDVKVTVSKLTDTASLPMAAGAKLVSDVFEFIKDISGDFTVPVTITLSFDKSQVDTDKYDIAICWLNEATDEWVQLDNVSVDLTTGKVSGDVTHFTKFAVIAVEKSALSDISGHWAKADIDELVALGAITGYPDGTFKPDNQITRAEFATVLVKAFKLQQQSGKVFGDTAGHWAASYIATAAANGIVNGYNDSTFGPDDPITREQIAAMIVRAAKLEAAATVNEFTDSDEISAWAESAVATATSNSIINGYPDNSFKPLNNATRAEAATMIVRALK